MHKFFYITDGLIVNALMYFYPSAVIQPWFCCVTQHKRDVNSADAFSRVFFFFLCVVCATEILWAADILSGQTSGGERWNSCTSASSRGTQVVPEKDKQHKLFNHPRNVSMCLGIWVCVCPVSSIFSGFYRFVDKTHSFSFSSLNTKPVC